MTKKLNACRRWRFYKKFEKTPARSGVLSAECSFAQEPHFLWKTLLELNQTLVQESSKDL